MMHSALSLSMELPTATRRPLVGLRGKTRSASFKTATCSPTSRCMVRASLNNEDTPDVAQPSAPEGGPAAPSPQPAPLPFQQPAPSQRALDPYRAAGQRLQNLLAGIGDGEEELLNSLLMEERVETKVSLALGAGCLISAGACFACWLVGLDPLGGASLSLGTLRAAVLGAAAATPLVAVKALLWTDNARSQLPFLEEIQTKQVEEFEPVLHQLTSAQCLIVLGSEVIPGLLILLPAATGGIAKTLDMYCAMAGVQPPPFLPPATALTVAACLAAISKMGDVGVTTEEYETVKDALDNADRFYRVMAVENVNGERDDGRSGGFTSAVEAAAAFKVVAVTWLARRQVAARFAATMSALEVLYLGILWQLTGDLAAPLMAALAAGGVDFAYIRAGMRSVGGKRSNGPSAS